MEPDPTPFGIRGFLIDSRGYGSLRRHRDGAIIVAQGRIAEVGANDDLRKRPRPMPVHWLDHEMIAIFPGLIDCHTHLPQYSAVARGESQLLPWLRETFSRSSAISPGRKRARRRRSSWF